MLKSAPSQQPRLEIIVKSIPESTMQQQITYLILAGGRGQRMNGADKGLMQWQGKPMIEHILASLGAPAEQVIVSANRNLQDYQNYAGQVVEDRFEDFQGPLAGLLSAMRVCDTEFLLCVPCDSPAPPIDMLQQLHQCMSQQQKTSAICHDGNRLQPLFCLINCQHLNLLEQFLQQGRRKVHDFMQMIDPAICDFSSQASAFNNFNRPEDMQDAQ